MDAVIFSTFADASALAAQVDDGIGCPIPGADVGGGQHDDQATVTYAPITKHPTLAQWAYPADATTRPYIDAAGLTVSTLDASWLPPSAAAS